MERYNEYLDTPFVCIMLCMGEMGIVVIQCLCAVYRLFLVVYDCSCVTQIVKFIFKKIFCQ